VVLRLWSGGNFLTAGHILLNRHIEHIENALEANEARILWSNDALNQSNRKINDGCSLNACY